MPKSKHRKPSQTKRNKRILFADFNRRVHQLRLRPEGLAALRDSSDFTSIMKLGRLMNSIGFCIRVYRMLQRDDLTWRDERDVVRALMIWIGFLFEGFLLVEGMQPRYSDLKCFQPLSVLPDTYSFPKSLFKLIRNRVSFHMDTKDISMRQAIRDIEENDYAVFTMAPKWEDWCFNLADELDWVYVENLIEGAVERDSLLTTLESMCFDISQDFSVAFDKFLQGIFQRLCIAKDLHVVTSDKNTS